MRDREMGSTAAWPACAEDVRSRRFIGGDIGHQRTANPSAEMIG
jgi:hypothetical protein